MNIPFLDLQAQYKNLKQEVNSAIQKVVENQFFILGPELEAFEDEFAKYLGIKYAVGVNSGTDALMLGLLALGIGRGDEVITPANGFISTLNAIVQVGATPILVDCDADTYQIDINDVEKNITNKTKAILPVHLYGAPVEIDKLQDIARRNKLFIVEDACQAHGSTFGCKKAGTFGDLGVFSFYPSKNLGAFGDGGAIVTGNKYLYDKLLKLRNYGQVKKYYYDTFGVNSRLDEIQAAILRVKIKYLDNWNRERNRIANYYNKSLKGHKTQAIIKNGKSCYYIFVIEVTDRNKLQQYLLEKGIHTLIHYPVPIHLQKANAGLGYMPGDFSNSEKLSKTLLSLPIYPEITEEKLKYIAEAINDFFEKRV